MSSFMKAMTWSVGSKPLTNTLKSLFQGGESPAIPTPEPLPPVETVVPVQQVTQKEEEEAIRKSLAKRRRATILAKGIENQPNIYRQKLGAGG